MVSPPSTSASRYVLTNRSNRSEQLAPVDEPRHLPRAASGTIQDSTPVAIELLDEIDAIQRARFLFARSEFQKGLGIEGAAIAIADEGQPILQGLELKILLPQFVLRILKLVLVAR